MRIKESINRGRAAWTQLMADAFNHPKIFLLPPQDIFELRNLDPKTYRSLLVAWEISQKINKINPNSALAVGGLGVNLLTGKVNRAIEDVDFLVDPNRFNVLDLPYLRIENRYYEGFTRSFVWVFGQERPPVRVDFIHVKEEAGKAIVNLGSRLDLGEYPLKGERRILLGAEIVAASLDVQIKLKGIDERPKGKYDLRHLQNLQQNLPFME